MSQFSICFTMTIVLSMFLISCDGTTTSSSPYTGLWITTFEDSEDPDPIDYYIISIDDSGLVQEYDCVPTGGFEVSRFNSRLIENGKVSYFRSAAYDDFPSEIKETYAISGEQLSWTIEQMSNGEDVNATILYDKLESLPATCNDNALKLSNVLPLEVDPGSQPIITFDYEYKIAHLGNPGNDVTLTFDLLTKDAQGNSIIYYPDSVTINESPVLDGSVVTGSFMYTFAFSEEISGKILQIVPQVTYTTSTGNSVSTSPVIAGAFHQIQITQP